MDHTVLPANNTMPACLNLQFTVTGFPNFTLSRKGTIFLPWLWTLAYDTDLRTWPRHDQVEPPCL